MCICHMSVLWSSRPFLSNEENTLSLSWVPMLSQVLPLTHCGPRRYTAWPCCWTGVGMKAGHHVIRFQSTATQSTSPLHFSGSPAASARLMCDLNTMLICVVQAEEWSITVLPGIWVSKTHSILTYLSSEWLMPEAEDHHSLSCTNYDHGDSQVIGNGFRL